MWSEAPLSLPWRFDPREALRRWPTDRRVLLLHSARFDPRWSRWTVVAEADAAFVHSHGRSDWIGWSPPRLDWSHDPLTDLGHAIEPPPVAEPLWIGHVAYDVARSIERLPQHAEDDRDWPIIQMHRCPGWLVYDGESGEWTAHGAWARSMVSSVPPLDRLPSRRGRYEASEPQPMMPREAYEAAVQRGVEYVAAGDVFQVNLAQRLTSEFRGDPRALYDNLIENSPAWYAAYLECLPSGDDAPQRIIGSTSPELFLAVTQDGHVVTRPIKGTRPAGTSPQVLEASLKDQAELHMIVDLLRNDLGRVCRFGSVQVAEARVIESHPTVHHGVATIVGQLREGVSLIDLLRATMPGGSITGAPKVRAMEIIEELEPVRRGPYCGAIGWIRGGQACFNIAIRTMLLELGAAGKGWIDFSVGAGIVGDSDPAAEYDETMDKAAAILAALRGK